MDSLAQVAKPGLKTHLVVRPRHAIYAWRGVALELIERLPEQSYADVVWEREPFLLFFPSYFPYAVQRLCHTYPVLRPARALPTRVPLGPALRSTDSAADCSALFAGFLFILQMDAHQASFRDESFDVVIGCSVLHHLECDTALREIYRILKVGGFAIFTEPLFDNPAGKVWRALTPGARTFDEQPLSRLQIRYGDSLFSNHDHRFVNLASTPLAMLTSLLSRRPDNWLLKLAHRIDLALERTPARYWMRTVHLVWQK